MHSLEEEKLADYKRIVDGLPVPDDLLEAAILHGFEKGRQEKKRGKQRRMGFITFVAAAVILISFFSSIKLSPAFAGYVSELPGFAKLVDLIQGDKGIIAALESEYDQEIGVSSTKDGVTFTITRAIADETGLLLFYTIDTLKERKEIFIQDAKLKSMDGKRFLLESFSFGMPHYSLEGEKSFTGSMDFTFQEPLETKSFNLIVKIEGKEHEIDFKLNKEISSKKEYVLNKTVSIEGQKITFEKVEIYPLRVAIHVKMDPNNTKRILCFDEIRLVDEHGEVWNKSSNGIIASGGVADDRRILYVQSNYFKEPRELYLIPGNIQAIDKSEAYLIADAEKGTILKQPHSGKFIGVTVSNGNELSLRMKTEKKFNSIPNGMMRDADGKEVVTGGFSKYEIDGYTVIGISIPSLNKYKNPLSLELNYYPSWIKSEEKVRIK